MTVKQQTDFIRKLIEQTKEHRISWQREAEYDCDISQSFWAKIATINYSFQVHLLKINADEWMDDHIELILNYDPGVSNVEFEYAAVPIASELLRLHNLVYDQFPNAEKVVDDFINNF